jgi:hypothetical protein
MHSTCPTHLILHALITLFWWKVLIMKLLVMQFSPLPCHLVQLRHKYLLQHHISNTLSLCSILSVQTNFHTHTK